MFSIQQLHASTIHNLEAQTILALIRPSLLQYYDKFVSEQEEAPLEPSTLKTYKTRYRILKEYLTLHDLTDIKPKEIDERFVNEFCLYLRSKKKYVSAYIAKNIQLLQRILEAARINGDIEKSPIKDFKVKYSRKIKIVFLDLEELQRLEKWKFKTNRLKRVRDLFVFCCYTGFAFADVKQFNSLQHILKVKGQECIKLHRKKTGAESFVPLLPTSKKILEKYSGKLPILTNQRYNSYLKEISVLVGIHKPISTHTARKTFAMIMHNEFDIPLETLQMMLGHDSLRTTQQWYAHTSMSKVVRDMLPVTKFFIGQ